MPKGVYDNHAHGSRHARWQPGGMLSSQGYVKLRVGKSHPLGDTNGYAYEHTVTWVSAGNPRPLRGQVIHHRNGDKTDNRLENLELITRGGHNAHHNKTDRGRDAQGRFTGAGEGVS